MNHLFHHKRSGSIKAEPNPIPISDFGSTGSTTLSWRSEGTEQIEIRARFPNGQLIARGGPIGSITTERLVINGSVFFLQDVSKGLPLIAENTLDTVTVHVFNSRFTTGLPSHIQRNIDLHCFSEGSPGKILVAGWFSLGSDYGMTAGDLLALDVVCECLKKSGYSYDVALSDLFPGGTKWDSINPKDYSHFIFVCGPCKKIHTEPLLKRLTGCRLIGINLSMLLPLDLWNPFDVLIERDSSVNSRADIIFATRQQLVPMVGVILVEPIPEYPDRAMHETANQAIRKLISLREVSVVDIDTRLPYNITGLRSPAEIESLIARMDVVLTTRLHGLVLALKNGVPAIAIDPHRGGSKVRRQADTIGWPVAFNPDTLTDQALIEAFDYCLSEAARRKARECAERAIKMVEKTKTEIIASLNK
jgi:hypothetical protein